MIKSHDDLKQYLQTESILYYGNKKTARILAHSKNYEIFRYISALRHEEYYKNTGTTILGKCLYYIYKRKKNIKGQKLGFDIPANCFEKGLLIHHVGSVIVNRNAKIGENCTLTGNVCIGSNSSGTPVIGNDCRFGYGSTVIGGIRVADGCIIGAGAVVTKNCEIENSILAGVPAKIIGTKRNERK